MSYPRSGLDILRWGLRRGRRVPVENRCRLGLMPLEGRFVPATFIVTNSNDSGVASLRQAVNDSNALAGTDTILFPGVTGTIGLSTGEIAITDSVNIQGPGIGLVTVNGDTASRIFNTSGAPASADISISGLNMTGGKTATSGGAMMIDDEHVSFTDCAIFGNSALGNGGAIVVNSSAGSLTLTRCFVLTNSATGGGSLGGAVAAFGGTVTLDACAVSNNSSADSGGAFYLLGGSAKIAVTNSLISGNTSTGQGGGIYSQFMNQPGAVTVTNSTISGNSGSRGGGLFLRDFDGGFLFQNSTITNNTAGPVEPEGGGLFISGGSGSLVFQSTILAGNNGVSGPDWWSDSGTRTITGDNNLVGVADLGDFMLSGSGNQTGTNLAPLNAMLAGLEDYGGPTLTHKLLAGSPAINAGGNPQGLTFDQRGGGFGRVQGVAADIGAFEAQTDAPCVAEVSINGGARQRSRVTTVTIDFNQLVTLPGTPADAFELKRRSDDAIVGLSASVNNDVFTSVTLTFSKAVSEFGSLQDGQYKLTVLAAKVSTAAGALDGNCDGTGGDDYVSAEGLIHRLFGDGDGNGTVSFLDVKGFLQEFGLAGPGLVFDFDNDGDVDVIDFVQFRNRYGVIV